MSCFLMKPLSIAVALSLATLVSAHDGHEHNSTGIELDQLDVSATAQPSLPGIRDVDTSRFNQIQAKDLHDMFRTEPSVQVNSGTRNGQKLILRGIEDLNLNIQLDGARQGANIFHHQSRLILDPILFKAVQVETGPAAADAGPGALGGSVRFTTVDAQDLLRPGQTSGARLGVDYASADRSQGGVATLYHQANENLGLMLHGRYTDSDEMRVGGGDKLSSSAGVRKNIFFKASLLDYQQHDLRFSAEQISNTGGQLRANFPWQTNAGTVRALDNQKMDRTSYTVNHRYNPDNDLLDLNTTLYQGETRLSVEMRGGEDWLTRSHGLDVFNRSLFNLGAIKHELTYGIDYFYDKGILESRSQHYSETAKNTGIYLQSRVSLTDDLHLSAGLRGDFFKSVYANDASTSGHAYSPNLSVEYDVLSGDTDLTLFAGYGESVRGGKLNQAGWLDKYTADFVLGEGGKLRPERAKLSEAGIKWHRLDAFTSNDHLGFDISFFDTRIHDYQVVPGEGPQGKTESIFNAPGVIRSRGYQISSHWGVQNLLLDLSYLHSKVSNYDGQPMDTSGDSARVGASSGDRLVVDAQWQVTATISSGYTLTHVRSLKRVPQNRPEKPGYTLHDVRLSWMPYGRQEKFVLFAGIDNLLDKRYAEHTTVRLFQGGGSELATWESGRNVKVGLNYFF
jgi:hemoglobin/transferrin/lactoferrin receptor protein